MCQPDPTDGQFGSDQGESTRTSIRNNHLQPDWPLTPRICRMPYARRAEAISAILMAVQKKPSRTVNS